MEDKPNSRAFHDLEENHVEIPQHIKNILTQMGFIGLRAFSRLKPNDLKEIENGVRSILAGNAESMTPQEKLNVFGKAFASKPDQFQFLPGNRTVDPSSLEIEYNHSLRVSFSKYVASLTTSLVIHI